MNKIEMGKTYRTRDGREVRIYAVDGGLDAEIHGAVLDKGGNWLTRAWCSNGSYAGPAGSPCDLIEVRPRIKRDVWVNVYEGGWVYSYSNRADADRAELSAGRYGRLVCVKLTIDVEHGHGLDGDPS